MQCTACVLFCLFILVVLLVFLIFLYGPVRTQETDMRISLISAVIFLFYFQKLFKHDTVSVLRILSHILCYFIIHIYIICIKMCKKLCTQYTKQVVYNWVCKFLFLRFSFFFFFHTLSLGKVIQCVSTFSSILLFLITTTTVKHMIIKIC